MVRVVLTGTRDCEIAAANGHHANPAILRLHPTYRSGAKRRTGTPLQTRLASMTEAAKHHRSVSLEEPGARVKHEAPGHPSRDVFGQAGRLEDGRLRLHRLKDGETSLGPSWGRPLLLYSASRRSRSRETHCALLIRHALTARTKQYGLTSRSTGPKTQLSEACPIYAAS